MTTEEEKLVNQLKHTIKQLREKRDGLSAKARARHRQEILQLKRSLQTAQKAVDSEEYYRIKNAGLKENNRQLKQDKIKLERKNKFLHKEYERILDEYRKSIENKSSDKQNRETSEPSRGWHRDFDTRKSFYDEEEH